MNLRTAFVTSIASALLTMPALSFADTLHFSADLKSSSEVPAHHTGGYGRLIATYDTASNLLHWKIIYADLTGPATMAHFHGPAAAGKNAPPVIAIPTNQLASPIEGSAKLSDAQRHDLMNGLYYFNVHTAQNPAGEIRGQIEQIN